jgi:branched-chain amino acid transport system ATP-binding protein
MAARKLLEVTGLHAGYGRAEVLAGVSIEAAAGSVVAVVGPNGAGKSTLLNALMGVLPSRGEIRFDGEPVQRLSLEQRVQRGVALVPETRALFATMPVADNLLLGGYRQRRAPQPEQSARLDGVYALFPRLHERRAQAAGTLSGGERQMLAIGRALMGAPRLLMLDEPSLGLAPWSSGRSSASSSACAKAAAPFSSSSRTHAPRWRWPTTPTCWRPARSRCRGPRPNSPPIPAS